MLNARNTIGTGAAATGRAALMGGLLALAAIAVLALGAEAQERSETPGSGARGRVNERVRVG